MSLDDVLPQSQRRPTLVGFEQFVLDRWQAGAPAGVIAAELAAQGVEGATAQDVHVVVVRLRRHGIEVEKRGVSVRKAGDGYGLDPQVNRRVADLWNEGMTAAAIAADLELTRQAVLGRIAAMRARGVALRMGPSAVAPVIESEANRAPPQPAPSPVPAGPSVLPDPEYADAIAALVGRLKWRASAISPQSARRDRGLRAAAALRHLSRLFRYSSHFFTDAVPSAADAAPLPGPYPRYPNFAAFSDPASPAGACAEAGE